MKLITAGDRKGEDSRDQDHIPVYPCKHFTGQKESRSGWCLIRGESPYKHTHNITVDHVRFPIAGATSPGCIQRQNRKFLTGLACTNSRTAIPPVILFVTPFLFNLLITMQPVTAPVSLSFSFGSCLLRVSWSFGHCQRQEIPLALLSDWQWSVTPLALNFLQCLLKIRGGKSWIIYAVSLI